MFDLERIRTAYRLGRSLQATDIQRILKAAKVRTFAAKELLIEAGETEKHVYFIRTGLVREFVLMESGIEKTMSLRCEHDIVASPDLYLFDQPARFSVQALEPTTVWCIDDATLQSIIQNNEAFTEHRKNVHLKLLKEAHQRIESFVLYSPEERYQRYAKANPSIMARAPDKYIAHVLGITPVSLSRIRRRVQEKKKANTN